MPGIKTGFTKKHINYAKYIAVILICIILANFALRGIAYLSISRQLNNVPANYVLKVEAGSGLIAIINDLATNDLINNPRRLKLWYYIYGIPSNLQRGEYQVSKGMSIHDLVLNIATGKQQLYYITADIGTTFADFYAKLISHPHLTPTTKDMEVTDIMNLIASDYRHPEGLFYADTYYFYAGDKDISILKKSNERLLKVLQEEWSARREGVVYKDPYEALIMASIVEKETGLDEERPLIAGVFNKRLSIGMRLQTDPTVIYGMGDNYNGNIRRSDLRRRTPYNTYVIYGLPPTPIALVDSRAINAALNPIDTEYLFFVAKGDSSRSHYFSTTLKEHNAAVRKFQLRKSK